MISTSSARRKAIPVGKPYVYRGPERDLTPEIRARIGALRDWDAPDPNPDGYEWRREALAEHADPPPPAPEPAAEPRPRCGRCGYLVIRCACPGGTR